MNPEQEAEWLEWRKGGITASDIARAWTGSYGGKLGVVADKLGIDYGDKIDPKLAERGHRWEGPIADAIQAVTGYAVYGEQAWLTHSDDERWRATADGFLGTAGMAALDQMTAGLEIKTHGINVRRNEDYATTQAQWQMFVSRMPRACIAYARINDLAIVEDEAFKGLHCDWIERDEFLISQLIELGEELWGWVQKGELPPAEGPEALPIIKAAHAKANPEAVAEIDDIEDTIAEYSDLEARLKLAEDAVKVAEAKIREAMADATEAHTSDGRWRVRVGKPILRFTSDSEADALDMFPEYATTVLDRRRFKEEQPGQYEKLRYESTDRRITIKDLQK